MKTEKEKELEYENDFLRGTIKMYRLICLLWFCATVIAFAALSIE